MSSTSTTWISEDGYRSNYSLSFDGSTSYIDLRDGTTEPIGWPIGSTTRTISAWIRPSTVSGLHYIFSYGTLIGGTGQAWNFYQNGTTIRISAYATEVASSPCLTADAWSHVVVTFDGGNGAKLYENGDEVGSGDFAGTIDTSMGKYNAAIGASNYPEVDPTVANVFAGKIDEVAIWNKELQADAIVSIYNSGLPTDLSNENNLAGYWRMEEGAGSSIADNSSNSNTGTIIGASWSEDTPSTTVSPSSIGRKVPTWAVDSNTT